MYKNLVYTKTAGMTHEEWETMRRSLRTIGGSDAPTILGLNEYSSPYALWCEKTGKIIPEDISDKESVRLGNDLEQYVAQRWMEKTGKKVRRLNAVIANPDLEFAHANVDRVVVGEDAVLECKTTSSWDIAAQCRDGKFPDRYYAQCVHYMLVTGCRKVYLAVLCFGIGFFDFELTADDAELNALKAAESDFFTGVITNTPPSIDGTEATSDALRTIYPDAIPGKSIDLSAVGHHVDAYNALGRQIKELTEQQDAHANAIKDFMGNAEKGTYGSASISWKTSLRSTFDKKAYEAANGRIPDIYYKVTESRSFRVNVKKEK